MKLKTIFVAGVIILFTGNIYAQTNITLGKDVHLIGGPFSHPLGVGWVVDPQTIVDGVFLPASSDWLALLRGAKTNSYPFLSLPIPRRPI